MKHVAKIVILACIAVPTALQATLGWRQTKQARSANATTTDTKSQPTTTTQAKRTTHRSRVHRTAKGKMVNQGRSPKLGQAQTNTTPNKTKRPKSHIHEAVSDGD